MGEKGVGRPFCWRKKWVGEESVDEQSGLRKNVGEKIFWVVMLHDKNFPGSMM